MHRVRKTSALGAAVAVAVSLTISGAGTLRAQEPGAGPSPIAAPAALTPAQQLALLSLPQRVGQLFMVAAAATGADASTMADLTSYHVGNVYLSGRSSAGTAATASVVRRMTSTVSAATTGGVPLTVATDQEGGYVQVLSGPGFSTMATALVQGTKSTGVVQSSAQVWGSQLRAAGLTANLAPVLDTVPSAQFAPYNAPIGYYQREFGYTPQTVSSHGSAFITGMHRAGIAPVIKHFPGLGRVTLNTDTSSNVHDRLTTRTDAYLLPYRTAIQWGVRWVMVSSAYYDRIDAARPGPLSPVIMYQMLRTDLHFTGIVLSDDLCNAVQMSPWSLATRATGFIRAGGTMVLCGDPRSIPGMVNAVVSYAEHNAVFAAAVNAAALKVLTVKAGS